MCENNTLCVDDFWQQVAKFVFDISNLYSFLKYLRYRKTSTINQGRRNGGA